MEMSTELTSEILHRLQTAESILTSKCVCKEWNSVLAHKRIGLLFGFTQKVREEKVTQLFYKELIEEEDIYTMTEDFHQMLFGNNGGWHIIQPSDKNMSHPIVGSCNGLVCFYVSHHGIQDPIYIMNPTTGEHLHLPQIRDPTPTPQISWEPRYVVGGFGYCEHTGEYKVVRIQVGGKVDVHTLGDNKGWRNIGEFPFIFRESGVYAHGCIFWINHYSYHNDQIVSFNLDDETFQSHSPPPHHIYENAFSIPILGMVFSGARLLFYNLHNIYDLRIDFWAPISDNDFHARAPGVEWNWELKRSIILGRDSYMFIRRPYKLIALGKNNDILMQNNRCLMRYNELNRTLTEIAVIDCAKVRVIPHMRSTVSLMNFGGKSETCTDEVHATNRFRV